MKPQAWAVESDTGCWIWSERTIHGRPVILSQGLYQGAARVLWIRKYGDILRGHHILNICGNHMCVNPYHTTLKGSVSVAKRIGRSVAELSAIVAVIKAYGEGRAYWDVSHLSDVCLSQSFVEELAIRLGTPPIMIHSAFAKLVKSQRAKMTQQDPADHDASLRAVERAQEMLSGEEPQPEETATTDGWLPPLD